MAKNRSQAEAFDFAADIVRRRQAGAARKSPAPAVAATPTQKPEAGAPDGRLGTAGPTGTRPQKRDGAKKEPSHQGARARNGSKPCARALKARNIQLFADQLKPLALMELETGENRSEIVRRLLDAELKARGYL